MIPGCSDTDIEQNTQPTLTALPLLRSYFGGDTLT